MNKKRILAIIMSLTLAFGIVGCGKSENGGSSSTETTKEETSSDSEDGFKKIELTKENVFDLGAKQTKEIKSILDKYGVKNAYNSDKNTDVPINIAKDENDCSLEGGKGYNITTTGDIKVNDGGEHQYKILYNAYESKDTKGPRYLYQITIDYPMGEEFKLDNFKMFKELVQEVQGEDYDFASLETFMKDHIKKIQADTNGGASAREVGSFYEGVQGGDKRVGKNTNMVIFNFSLRK